MYWVKLGREDWGVGEEIQNCLMKKRRTQEEMSVSLLTNLTTQQNGPQILQIKIEVRQLT